MRHLHEKRMGLNFAWGWSSRNYEVLREVGGEEIRRRRMRDTYAGNEPSSPAWQRL